MASYARYKQRERRESKWKIAGREIFDPVGFVKVFIDNFIGYGIFTTKEFQANDILLEYKGTVISERNEILTLRKKYADENVGCFMCDFRHNDAIWSIDATLSTNLSKYVNDSHHQIANCEMKKIVHNDIPHLYLVASKTIPNGCELRYDYCDIENLHWRSNDNYSKPFTLEEVKAAQYGKPIRKKESLKASKVLALIKNSMLCKRSKIDINTNDGVSSNTLTNSVRQSFERIETVDINKPDHQHITYSADAMTNIDEQFVESSKNTNTDQSVVCGDTLSNVAVQCHESSDNKDVPVATFPLSKTDNQSINERRRKFKCIEPGCEKEVINLPRHLTNFHDWSKSDAKHVINQFGLRKNYVKTQNTKININEIDTDTIKKPYERKNKLCPLVNCNAVVKRMDEHLQKSHCMEMSVKYFNLLAAAKVYTPGVTSDTSYTSCHCINKRKQRKNRDFDNNDTNETSIEKEIQPMDDSLKFTTMNYNSLASESDTYNNDNSNYCTRLRRKKIDFNLSDSITSVEDNDNDNDNCYSPDKVSSTSLKEVDCLILPLDLKRLLEKYYIFLTGPDGGLKNETASKNEVREVERLAFAINALSVEDLFDADKINKKYLTEYCIEKNHSPASIQKYLRSLRDFYDFSISESLIIPNITTDDKLSLKTKCSGWIKKYNKKAKEKCWEKEERECELMIEPKDIAVFLSSYVAKSAKNLLHEFQRITEQVDVTVSQYCLIRDYLYFEIQFNNCHRSGVISNALLEEFAAGKREPNGTFVFRVRKHKTFAYHGPASVCLTKEVFDWITTYVQKVRPQVDHHANKYLFLSWTGKKFDSGAVSRRLKVRFEEAGIEKSVGLTSNLIRKSGVSGIRKANLPHHKEAAVTMAHHLSTANKIYDLTNRREDSVIGGRVLRQYFFGNDASPNITEESPESIQENLDIPSVITSSATEAGCVDQSLVLPNSQETKIYPSPSKSFSPKKMWTKSDEDQLKRVFEQELSQRNILKYDVKKKLSCLQLEEDLSENQIYNKLRSLVRGSPIKIKRKEKKKRRMKLFTIEEQERIAETCKDVIKGGSLTKEKLRPLLGADPIWKKITFAQIRTRIAYERNMLRLHPREKSP